MKIAVVDDEESTQEIIADYLNDHGHTANGFHDPEELQQTARDYEAIIMDVMIGKVRTKGITSIRDWVGANMIKPGTRVIFISNFGRESKEIKELLVQLGSVMEFRWLDKHFLDTVFFNQLHSTIEG